MPERLLVEFLERYHLDRAEGRTRSLSDYLREAAGAETLVAEHYARLQAGDSEASEEGRDEPTAAAGIITRVGPYELVRELGRGGQGVVYEALDPRLKRRVALKVLQGGLAASDDALIRFRQEATIMARLEHPGICVVHDVGREGGVAWLAMRIVEGRPLSALLAELTAPPATRAEWMPLVQTIEQAARAIDAAHEAGVVHRDLKPSNIMVTPDGSPVILDFGLARDLEADGASLTQPGSMFGTPAYVAPERMQPGAGRADRGSDVYALGVCLYRALTLELPYVAATFDALCAAIARGAAVPPRVRNRVMPKDLDVIVRTAIASDPRLRYATARDLAEDLRRFREGEPIAARPVGPVRRLGSWARRHKAVAASIAAVIVAAAGVLAMAVANSITSGNQLAVIRRQYADLLQLSDARLVSGLLARERELWPAGPPLVAACDAWTAEARAVLDRRGLHESARERLRERAVADSSDASGWTYALDSDKWLAGLLDDLIGDLGRLQQRAMAVEERRDRSQTLAARSIGGEHAEEWEKCAERVQASPKYDSLELPPQLGLVPLGPSPRSGLWEFWHVESGERPPRGDGGELVLNESSGIVLVLVPGGTRRIGSDLATDRQAKENEAPPQDLDLAPYFISKFEMTQAQWRRIDEDRNPAFYFPGTKAGKESDPNGVFTLVHPVENVSWFEASAILARLDLVLPTEAQWEAAARGGTDTPWSSGSSDADLTRYANVLGGEWQTGGDATSPSDRHLHHAPVGSYLPNPFGLHDVHGNVYEWCRDRFCNRYTDAVPAPGDGLRDAPPSEPRRALRGGGFLHEAPIARSARRNRADAHDRERDLGIRPCRPVR